MRGETWGAEAWGHWQATSRWRLSPGVRLVHKSLGFAPGASALVGLEQAGNDPRWQGLLGSSLQLARQWSLELQLRHVGSLPAPRLPSYTELNANLMWRPAPAVELSLRSANLLDRVHQEYPVPSGVSIRRSALVQVRWHPSR